MGLTILCKIFLTFIFEYEKYSTQYRQSHITLLCKWIMLWRESVIVSDMSLIHHRLAHSHAEARRTQSNLLKPNLDQRWLVSLIKELTLTAGSYYGQTSRGEAFGPMKMHKCPKFVLSAFTLEAEVQRTSLPKEPRWQHF